MYKIVLVVALLLCSIGAPATHRLEGHILGPPSQEYLKALIQQQAGLNEALMSAKAVVTKIQGDFLAAKGNDTAQAQVLRAGIASEKDLVEMLQRKLTIPLNSTQLTCTNPAAVTTASQTLTAVPSTYKIDVLMGKLNSLPETQACSKVNTAQLTLLNNLYELEQIKAPSCADNPIYDYPVPNNTAIPFSPMPPTTQPLITNPQAPDWIYGGLDPTELKLQQFDLITSQNVTMCPLDRPYASNLSKSCIDCSGATPIFNVKTQTCVSCPYYNETSHQCQNLSKAVCNSMNMLFNAQAEQCTCPSALPNYNGTHCIICYYPLYFDKNFKKCLSCPDTQIFNLKTGACEPCPAITPVAINNKCYAVSQCKAGFIYDQTAKKCTCPPNAPLETAAGTCTTCYLPQYWNTTSKTCLSCPEHTSFNINDKKCVYCDKETKVLGSTQSCLPCSSGATFDADKKACVGGSATTISTNKTVAVNVTANASAPVSCPPNMPFRLANSTCTACYLPKYWNFKLSACLSCADHQFYNTTSRSCQYCPQELVIIGRHKCSPCPAGTKWNESKLVCA